MWDGFLEDYEEMNPSELEQSMDFGELSRRKTGGKKSKLSKKVLNTSGQISKSKRLSNK